MKTYKDLTGTKKGKLEVICLDHHNRTHRSWICRCDCGNIESVRASALLSASGRTQCTECRPHNEPQHALERTYNSWKAMRQRCLNPSHTHYIYYGRRGIAIDPMWDSFENFLADMGLRPEGTTLDRRNPNGNYTKDNCRWATPTEQGQNKRRTKV
jgi:hypothetical protein